MRVKVFLVLIFICLYADALPRIRMGRMGGRMGGRFGGSRRTSSWGQRRSSSWGRNTPSSSYPRQGWSRPGGRTPGGLNSGRTSLGGGGFVRPKPIYKPNSFGQTQYSSFKPNSNMGRYSSTGGRQYGSMSSGYGTNWGTSFPSGVGRYSGTTKALGLGIGAGFLGGAALGIAGTMATYSVYHRYHEYQRMMHMMNPSYGMGIGGPYYNNYYKRNQCLGGCPPNAHCEWGFCECNSGLIKSYGSCRTSQGGPRPSNFNPFVACSSSNNSTCSSLDMNLVCNTNLTTEGSSGRCDCRRDMRWNTEAGECQIYMDVDCSAINYDTPVAESVKSAVQKMAETAGCPEPNLLCADGMSCITEDRVCDGVPDCPETETGSGGDEEDGCSNEEVSSSSTTPSPFNVTGAPTLERTFTKEESLNGSLLPKMDLNTTTMDELTEAFCRDIDAFSFEFQERSTPLPSVEPVRQVDQRPSLLCQKVPNNLCAIAYDSSTCAGGWKLSLPEGRLRFLFWSSFFKYRNDMDLVGVRAGCTFTGFSNTDYNGNSVMISATTFDRWVVFANDNAYRHMDEDIESVGCYCNR